MDDVNAETRATLQASRALLGVVARSVAGALDEVSLPQFRVLVLLSQHGPMRLGVIAQHLEIHPSTFSRNSDRMVASGWVKRIDDPERRGSIQIELTDTGRSLVDAVSKARYAEIAAILDRVPAGERQAVLDAFDTFACAAGEPSSRDLLTLGL